jgi:predicted transcriptional regulator
MKQKLGTALDVKVIRALKAIAAKEKRKISEVIEEALIQYLQRKQGETVERTRGAIPASPDVVKAILEEESFYETK